MFWEGHGLVVAHDRTAGFEALNAPLSAFATDSGRRQRIFGPHHQRARLSRYSEDDGYGLSKATVARTRGVKGRYIGVMSQIGARWTVNRHTQLLGNYSYLVTSDGCKTAGSPT